MTEPTTNPNVPLRIELEFRLPGTPEQLWQAIATADGISSWFLPTDLEEREGGALRFHMGDEDSPGTVTGWEPPHRLAYVEPDWATLAGQDPASVTPLATEFLVRAESGGTCVVHVVSSAFGSGAEWERKFFDEMQQGWAPFFDNLRLYLTHFAGQRAATFEVSTSLPSKPEQVLSSIRWVLGVKAEGQTVQVRDVTAQVERIGKQYLLLRTTGPLLGYLAFFCHDSGKGDTVAQIYGYLFSDDAERYVQREKPGWQDWLRDLVMPVTVAR